MSEEKDGGPAFGHAAQGGHHCGMSLRQYYAGVALQGFLASCANPTVDPRSAWKPETLASSAFQMADAMLAESKK